ncbi:PQQ-binding-like beta-propeller repeat protein [Streptomyces sp. NPDC059994]|uniref:outer membrane protein assembly factor BamB family protein n=1 Tax=Streptomyces sp. NPDC059994 TaxID=3347029 RepID=UPI003699FF16
MRENETQPTSAGGRQFGPWRLGDIVARAMYKEVTGHAVADGALKWSVALETPVCGAAHTPAAHGKLVIATLENNTARAHCKYLQQIDLATGKVGWKIEVPQESSYDTTNEFRLAVTGDTVAVSHSAYASGFSTVDGKKLFGTWKTAGCSPCSVGGGTRLIGVGLCSVSGDVTKTQQLIEELDPATGKSRWNYTYAPGWTVGRVYSTEPLVVAARNNDTKAWNITMFAPDGKVRRQVEPKFKVSGACDGFGDGSGDLHACTFAATDASTLYLGTAGSDGAVLGQPETNEVVAMDLGTGKERWRTKEPHGRGVRPARQGAERLRRDRHHRGDRRRSPAPPADPGSGCRRRAHLLPHPPYGLVRRPFLPAQRPCPEPHGPEEGPHTAVLRQVTRGPTRGGFA